MSVELNHISSPNGPSTNADHSLQQKTPKRKLGVFLDVPQREHFAYPSPPMSNPPSPLGTSPPYVPGTTTRALSAPPSEIAEPGNVLVPAVDLNPPTTQTAFAQGPSGHTTTVPTVSTSSPYITDASTIASVPGPPARSSDYTSQPLFSSPPAEGPSIAGLSSSRGGRRSKTHVASACINCKRAHLSCDVQRPCARCVASGKQETCVDVQHKKRGRPRLHEEGEFRLEQTVPREASYQSAPIAMPQPPPPPRPMATTRQRRGESFRSLRSVASDDSGNYAISPSVYPLHGILQSPFSSQQAPTPASTHTAFEIATALLNLDLVVIRANRPFQNILSGGQSFQGRHVSEFAASADNESFQAIRNRLRAERESREPAYMPPIQQPGQDPVLNVTEAEAEQFTHGFHDRTYTWTYGPPSNSRETFPVRIRLAKASTYFVVITLPSFRPVEHQQQTPVYSGPLQVGPPLQSRRSTYPPPRQVATQSAPPIGYQTSQAMPTPMLLGPAGGPEPPISRTYPPPQLYQPFPVFAAAPTGTPRLLPIAEPPVEAPIFTPPFAPMELPRPPGAAGLLLPPIAGSSPRSQPADIGRQLAESTDEEGDGRPRSSKKRRMDIGDVLQR